MGNDGILELPSGNSRSVPGFQPDRLVYLRKSKAMLTQEELARAAGCSRGAVSHYEQGRRRPMVTTLRGLCLALGCEPGDLIASEGIEDDGHADGRPAEEAANS